MSHEGRMARGKLKLSKGIKDIETEYYLANKPQEKKEAKPEREAVKKDVKSNK